MYDVSYIEQLSKPFTFFNIRRYNIEQLSQIVVLYIRRDSQSRFQYFKVVFDISKSFSIFQSRFRYFKVVFDISKSFSIFQNRFRYFKIVFDISKSFPIAIEELLHCHELVCVRHNDESVLCQNIIACLVVFLVVVNCYDMIHDDGVVTVFLSFGIVVA